MYEKHFSFKHKPFELVPNPDFLFPSSTHKKAITYLDYGIKEKVGFILLTGEIGSGKTTIIRNFIKNLEGPVKLSKINNTKVSSEQLISMINEDFGLDVEGKSKTRLLSDLNAHLIELYSRGIHPILLVDEAQNLSSDLLEEIRLLSNLETDKSKLLQIILVGQPELKQTLLLPELLQLRQRISINYHISPLTREETAQYITHRLMVAGNPGAMEFGGSILDIIYKFSRGIPRLINILCDFALLSAYADGRPRVDEEILQEVVKDLESYDYWNESNAGAEKTDQDADMMEAAGDMALRLIRLESLVNNNVQSLISLTEKMNALEASIAELTASHGQAGRKDELAGRILEIEKLLEGIADYAVPQSEGARGRSESEQLDALRKMVSRINEKLRRAGR